MNAFADLTDFTGLFEIEKEQHQKLEWAISFLADQIKLAGKVGEVGMGVTFER